MRMPPHDFQAPLGLTLYNGQPVRSDHAATVDEWSMYLAAAAGGAPQLPSLLTGSSTILTSGTGWRSNDTDWGDNPTITTSVLVPPFVGYMQLGIVSTGTGEVRITGSHQSSYVLIKINGTGTSNAVEDATVAWTDTPGPTGANTDHPIITVGYKVPTLQELVLQFRTTDTDYDLEVFGLVLRPWPQPVGADLNGLATSAGALAL